jgi:hypothetical protein
VSTRADDEERAGVGYEPPPDAEPGAELTVMLGFTVRPLFDGGASTTTAAMAVADSLPRRVSWEGNVMEITEIWPITAEILAEALRDPGTEPDPTTTTTDLPAPGSGPGDTGSIVGSGDDSGPSLADLDAAEPPRGQGKGQGKRPAGT